MGASANGQHGKCHAIKSFGDILTTLQMTHAGNSFKGRAMMVAISSLYSIPLRHNKVGRSEFEISIHTLLILLYSSEFCAIM